MKKILILIPLLIFTLSCSDDSDDVELLGQTWQFFFDDSDYPDSFTFTNSDSGTKESVPFNYSLNGNVLTMDYNFFFVFGEDPYRDRVTCHIQKKGESFMSGTYESKTYRNEETRESSSGSFTAKRTK